MDATEATVDEIIRREGGYVFSNRKNDRGGATFAGLTYTNYNAIGRATRQWPGLNGVPAFEREARAAEKDPKHPMRQRVRFAFKYEYLDRFKGLPAGLREMTQDAAINCGWKTAAKWVQKAVGAAPDGIVGPDTLRAARDMWRKGGDRRAVMLSMTKQRLERYGRLCQRKPAQVENLVGWQRRAMAVLTETMEAY